MNCCTISIHAPREGGDAHPHTHQVMTKTISIHAPREGGDRLSTRRSKGLKLFQSTPPARGATDICGNTATKKPISIHAPREGGDEIGTYTETCPRPFQSTPPARGATFCFALVIRLIKDFNPRPPRGGRPCARVVNGFPISGFQSTPPARGATSVPKQKPTIALFQSTPPARGATIGQG